MIKNISVLLLLSSFTTSSYAIAIFGQGTWETTLQARDLDGNPATAEAWYDTDLNITWLANAAVSGEIGIPLGNSFYFYVQSTGTIAGIPDWRFPNRIDIGSDGCNIGLDCGYNTDTASSELSHMYYSSLGNLATPGGSDGLTNTGPFSSLQPAFYWTNYPIMLAEDLVCVYYFSFSNGNQNLTCPDYTAYVWFVHDGDVGGFSSYVPQVPLPAALWLFASGFAGLIAIARRGKNIKNM